MSNNRYIFCNPIEDETLNMFASLAKDMMKQIDSIVKIYMANNELLYGKSPRQILFLMKQNNKRIFSSPPSPSNSINSYADISNPGPSTPNLRTSNIQILRRVNLLDSILDDGERKENNSGTIETRNPVKHQAVNRDGAILSPAIHEIGKINEQFTRPVSPIKSPSADNEFTPCSVNTMVEILDMDEEVGRNAEVASPYEANKKDSPRTAELTRITSGLTVEVEVGSPAKVASPDEANKNDSPRTAELTRITSSLTVEEKETSLVLTRADDEGNASNKDSSRSVGVIRHTSDIQLNYKDSESLEGEKQIDTNTDFLNSGTKSRKSLGTDSIDKHSTNLGDETFKVPLPVNIGNKATSPVKKVIFEEDRTAVKADYCKSGEKSGKSDNDDSRGKEAVSLTEKMLKTTNPIERQEATPSPTKMSKLERMSDVAIDECTSQTEKVQLTDCSLEGNDISTSPTQIDKINAGLNAECPTESDDRKRKSPTPKRNSTVFRSIPRVIKSPSGAEMVIEIPSDSENSPSPTGSSISPRVNSPLSKSPVMSDSKTDDSPNTVKRFLSPSERVISTDSPLNVSRAGNLGSDEDSAFNDNSPSGTSSIIETSIDQSGKSESSLPNNETEHFELKETVRKFHMLCSLRHHVLKNIQNSLLQFQNNVQFLNLFARNVGFIVNPISSLENFSSEELKEMASEATGIVTKLMRKFTAWLKDIVLEVETWQKCFHQIETLKTQYEPIIASEGDPLNTFEILQIYEYEMKSIWRKMDDMIMMADARRSLFSQTNYDFEKLIKIFVKCLIKVGILQPR